MTDRNDLCVIVIGRNRRVYARMYKTEKRIAEFSRHCCHKEIEKSRKEGFRPFCTSLERPNDTTWIFHVQYEAV